MRSLQLHELAWTFSIGVAVLIVAPFWVAAAVMCAAGVLMSALLKGLG